MDPTTAAILAAIGAALPVLTELFSLLSKSVAGGQVDPAAVKQALSDAQKSGADALDALEAAHAAGVAADDAEMVR